MSFRVVANVSAFSTRIAGHNDIAILRQKGCRMPQMKNEDRSFIFGSDLRKELLGIFARLAQKACDRASGVPVLTRERAGVQ